MKDTSKQRVNLTIPVFLLKEAKAMRLNLSQSAEAGIAAALKKQKEQQWLEENKDAIEAYNAWYDQRGPLFPPIWEQE